MYLHTTKAGTFNVLLPRACILRDINASIDLSTQHFKSPQNASQFIPHRVQIAPLIGGVEDKYVADDDTDLRDGGERDKSPRDRIEEVALEIPAPGPSMNSASRDAVWFSMFSAWDQVV